MARRVVTLDEKIRKAETAVASAKAKYDTALDELEKLVAKRKQLDDKKVRTRTKLYFWKRQNGQ